MPYISIKTTKKLTLQQTVALKKVSGELISIIPNKSEEYLMVHILDNQIMYFQGKELDCMKIDVQLWGKCENVYKQKFVKRLLVEVSSITSIPVEYLYLTLEEHENWGFQGEFY